MHKFIIVATDYYHVRGGSIHDKSAQDQVIKFIQHQIIYKFGILETITVDQGIMFTSDKLVAFMQNFRTKLICSSLYYTQDNGQAEANHKIVIDLIKKYIEDKLKRWHEILQEVLWSVMDSKTIVTIFTPYWLTYGYDAVLPLDINVASL
uniref:Uncharacterized protein LOC105852923 n=1 Tax=Cicer arietinum TaxID=3827 RepID=A0A1S3EIH9_CICAR|nr:uncharacterized protein LOC105852923 [Cicer arietinum]